VLLCHHADDRSTHTSALIVNTAPFMLRVLLFQFLCFQLRIRLPLYGWSIADCQHGISIIGDNTGART